MKAIDLTVNFGYLKSILEHPTRRFPSPLPHGRGIMVSKSHKTNFLALSDHFLKKFFGPTCGFLDPPPLPLWHDDGGDSGDRGERDEGGSQGVTGEKEERRRR